MLICKRVFWTKNLEPEQWKLYFLFTLSIVLSLSLNARENPLWQGYLWKWTGKHVDEAAIKKTMEESSYIKEMEEKMSGADKK